VSVIQFEIHSVATMKCKPLPIESLTKSTYTLYYCTESEVQVPKEIRQGI